MIAVRAHSIHKSFGAVHVLRGLSFHAEPGEIVGVVGPGGAGKSILLKSLCGLVLPDTGWVDVGGQRLDSLEGLALARVRQHFGVLFQNNALFDFMTVADNVAFPLRRERRLSDGEIAARVAARLEQVGLSQAGHLFPNELSGGMKKRVSLARATIAGASVLLYDDPTAGLDPVTSSKIFRLVAELAASDVTSVVASHDVDRMRPVCTRYVLVFDGAVRFAGTWDDAASSDDEVIRTFFGGSRGRKEGRAP